jgi:glycosyltransferase involved in cell wall biosynthesis
VVQQAAPEHAAGAVPYRAADIRPDDVLVYHAAHGSPLGAWLAGVDAVKIVDYHGITPPEFVRAYDPGLAVALAKARAELESLAAGAALGIAHSRYMERELQAIGFPNTATLPLLVDPARLAGSPDDATAARLRAGKRGHDLLFVSRMAPNKRIEDLLKVFAVYRRAWDREARLFVVGRPDIPAYVEALQRFAGRLGVEGVHFTGRVSEPELAAYYAGADIFVSMSEHEGFGLPWVEAMAFGVPVVAYAAGALPETVGDAGILFTEKCYEDVAALVDAVVGDAALCARLAAAGRERVAAFGPARFEARVHQVFGAWSGPAA